MPASDTSVILEETQRGYLNDLVEQGLYASVEDAFSGELRLARESRESRKNLIAAEVKRRADLPEDQWIKGKPGDFLDWFDSRYGVDNGSTK